jgi:hypothetical protein
LRDILQVFNNCVSTAEIWTRENGRREDRGSYCGQGLRKYPIFYLENLRKRKKTAEFEAANSETRVIPLSFSV